MLSVIRAQIDEHVFEAGQCHTLALTLQQSFGGGQLVAIANLWTERQLERGLVPSDDRSGSCKFAALLARTLFGGRLAGNYDHVFTLQPDGQRVDLNEDQPDAQLLGERAHRLQCAVLATHDYRDSLSSCVPRVERWANGVTSQLQISHSSALMATAERPATKSSPRLG
ncbi:hypothetical protein ACK8QS_22780 (plasmid) [Ectopseudomonas mendocina]